MALSNPPSGEQLTGAVEVVNARGIRVGGQSPNFCKNVEVPRPLCGQAVAVELDAKGFHPGAHGARRPPAGP